MSRPNFVVRVPSIPMRPRPRIKKSKKKSKSHISRDKLSQLEINCSDLLRDGTKKSSYYSLNSPENSFPKLKVIETYDEFLNLKDLDKIFWKSSSQGINSTDQSNEGIQLLKQICADLCLDVANSQKDCHMITSLFQTEHRKHSQMDIRTAIIAKRIVATQAQIANKGGFSKSSFNKSTTKSLGTIEELPHQASTILEEALLSGSLSKYLMKKRSPTSEIEVQVNIERLRHSCNTQTDVQPIAQHVQSCLVIYEDKDINTLTSSFHANQEQSTQMYEHITENDLLCMEWIDKNLFRVPVNPNTVIVDEKLRESSELTCPGTNVFEQELNWERQALLL